MDAEKSHDLTLKLLKRIEASFLRPLLVQKAVEDPVDVFGIRFPNRVGLAAGLDKNGICIDAFAALGFGHIEVGTVTPRAQPGNPKPRLFRLTKANGLINRFGFNNEGVDNLIQNIQNSNYKGVLGINIGKNFDTPVDKAVDDYMICLEKVYPYATYITVNISSPNTANLRQLQFGEALEELLEAIKHKQQELTLKFDKKVPVLIKIAPDLSDQEVQELASIFVKHKVDGIIATNTTFSRSGVEGLENANEQGGLSGGPIFSASTAVLNGLNKSSGGAIPMVGVGGIDSGDRAINKISSGASLIQIYSGFIYKGPALITETAEAIRNSH